MKGENKNLQKTFKKVEGEIKVLNNENRSLKTLSERNLHVKLESMREEFLQKELDSVRKMMSKSIGEREEFLEDELRNIKH